MNLQKMSSEEKIISYILKNSDLASQLSRQLVFEDFGLSASKYNILRILAEEKKPVQLSKLSHELGVSNANISGLVNRLERDGYLKKEQDSKDKRVTLAYLTDRGKKIYHQISSLYHKTFHSIFGGIPQEEQEEILFSLEKLHNYLRKNAAKSKSSFPYLTSLSQNPKN